MSRKRVVLVVPRTGVEDGGALAGALDQIANVGWDLVSVVDPAQHLDALHMVLDGVADVVVTTRAEHFPLVQYAADLSGERVRPGNKRTQRILRAETVSSDRKAEPEQPAADHPWRQTYSERRREEERVAAVEPIRTALIDRSGTSGDTVAPRRERRAQRMPRSA